MKIFSGKRYFNDVLWAPAYNNNTLPDQCLLKYMIICAFENSPPPIPSFLVTKIVYIGYGQLKK
jgi:hypothetical protein